MGRGREERVRERGSEEARGEGEWRRSKKGGGMRGRGSGIWEWRWRLYRSNWRIELRTKGTNACERGEEQGEMLGGVKETNRNSTSKLYLPAPAPGQTHGLQFHNLSARLRSSQMATQAVSPSQKLMLGCSSGDGI
jgi:hypothetical protein